MVLLLPFLEMMLLLLLLLLLMLLLFIVFFVGGNGTEKKGGESVSDISCVSGGEGAAVFDGKGTFSGGFSLPFFSQG